MNKNYTIPKIGSKTWLKELRKALSTPGFKITPPQKPLDLSNSDYTKNEKEIITVARALIDAHHN